MENLGRLLSSVRGYPSPCRGATLSPSSEPLKTSLCCVKRIAPGVLLEVILIVEWFHLSLSHSSLVTTSDALALAVSPLFVLASRFCSVHFFFSFVFLSFDVLIFIWMSFL